MGCRFVSLVFSVFCLVTTVKKYDGLLPQVLGYTVVLFSREFTQIINCCPCIWFCCLFCAKIFLTCAVCSNKIMKGCYASICFFLSILWNISILRNVCFQVCGLCRTVSLHQLSWAIRAILGDVCPSFQLCRTVSFFIRFRCLSYATSAVLVVVVLHRFCRIVTSVLASDGKSYVTNAIFGDDCFQLCRIVTSVFVSAFCHIPTVVVLIDVCFQW